MAQFSIETALAGAAVGSAVLAGAMCYLARQPGTFAGLRWWAAAYACNTLRFLLVFVADELGRAWTSVLAESAHAMTITLLLAGTFAFLGRRPSVGLLLGLPLAMASWNAFGVLTAQSFLITVGPNYAIAGLALIGTGLLLLRHRSSERHASELIIGLAFIFSGIHKWNYPLLRPIEWFAPFGFMIAQALMLIIAVGLVILAQQRQHAAMQRAFEDARREGSRRAETEQRLARIAANLPGIIYQRRLTGDGEIVFDYVSPQIEHFLGISPERVQASSDFLRATIHPDDYADWEAAVHASAKTLTKTEQEFRVLLHDGQQRWFRSIAIPHRVPNGDVVWDGVTLDVSEQKTAEHDLRRAMEQAEIANRAKSEFLANMSHELRTPLNAILGFSEMIEQEMVGAVGNNRYLGYAGDIHHSATHLLAIINDILDISKVEAGKVEAEAEPLDLVVLVQECLRSVEARARDGGIELFAALPAGCGVVSDPRMIRQVLLNLLSNAVKFTPRGGLIRVTLQLVGDDRVNVGVKDTGIGMSRDHLKRVMEPFVQVQNSQTRDHEGTGLGLPLAQRFTKMLGGRLEIDSVPGGGTTALITLPRYPSRDTATLQRTA